MERLKQQPIWVCWNRKEVNGRVTKVPCAASSGATGTSKEYAHTWVPYDEAVAAAKKQGYTGIGFIIPEGVFLSTRITSTRTPLWCESCSGCFQPMRNAHSAETAHTATVSAI